jgi:tyrosine-protein phosphatase SIW14
MRRRHLLLAAALAWGFGLLLAVLCWGCASTPNTGPVHGVPHFDQVERGIYRGGQPADDGWDYLASIGVSNVIKLNTTSEGSDDGATRRGMAVRYHPITLWQQLLTGPDILSMNEALAEIGPGTFIHCTHGEDRTGLLVGLYRLQEGWSKDKALLEMVQHGYHTALMGLTDYWTDAPAAR